MALDAQVLSGGSVEQRTRLDQIHEAGGTRIAVVSVPTGWRDRRWSGEREYWVICSCGWTSLPFSHMPREIDCEACDALAAGRRNFEDFAQLAAERGHRIERELQLVRGGEGR